MGQHKIRRWPTPNSSSSPRKPEQEEQIKQELFHLYQQMAEQQKAAAEAWKSSAEKKLLSQAIHAWRECAFAHEQAASYLSEAIDMRKELLTESTKNLEVNQC